MTANITYNQWVIKLISDTVNKNNGVEFGKWIFKLKQEVKKGK